ncbi:hypothetical protein POVWA1_046590 [Plasmodium ovale wallikeri]|uniref:Uncharacterized protein n=1 Tax=Plasmodium ovale wallikeri TaxID=864142 RepID=A0A1A8ZFX0_PLAOA|nr:hypothetical protein POVWA1_046590 [Plasmodium ovale wallikeri]
MEWRRNEHSTSSTAKRLPSGQQNALTSSAFSFAKIFASPLSVKSIVAYTPFDGIKEKPPPKKKKKKKKKQKIN